MKSFICILILSMLAFLLIFTEPFKSGRDADENGIFIIKMINSPKHKSFKNTTKHIEYHKGGKTLDYKRMKMTIAYVTSSIHNLKDVNKRNLNTLVLETMITETHLGTAKYEYSANNYKNYGIAQFRVDTAEYILKRLKSTDVTSYCDVMRFYNPQLSLKDNLLTNVKFSIALCAVYYYMRITNINEETHSITMRAKAWKKVYNTYKGLGTEELYIARVEKFLGTIKDSKHTKL